MTTPTRPEIKTLANLEAAFAGESMAHIKYRYFATSDPEFDGTEVEYASHNIYAGIRLNF